MLFLYGKKKTTSVPPLNAIETSSLLHIPEVDVLLGLWPGERSSTDTQNLGLPVCSQNKHWSKKAQWRAHRADGLIVSHCFDAMPLEALLKTAGSPSGDETLHLSQHRLNYRAGEQAFYLDLILMMH